MAISDIRTALANSLDDISGLRVFDKAPNVVEVPCVFITMGRNPSVEYHITAGSTGTVVYHFVVTLLVMEAVLTEAQIDLDAYLLPSGTSSVKTYIEAASFSTYADFAVCKQVEDYGVIVYNGVNYLGCRFLVEVWD